MRRNLPFLAFCVALLVGCGVPSSTVTSSPVASDAPAPVTSTSVPKEIPAPEPSVEKPTYVPPKPKVEHRHVHKQSTPEPGSVGYVGHLSSTGPHVPVCVESDDVSTITHRDQDGMLELMKDDKLFSADGGAKVKILAKKWAGLVQVRILEGESEGREGWLPDEIVH